MKYLVVHRTVDQRIHLPRVEMMVYAWLAIDLKGQVSYTDEDRQLTGWQAIKLYCRLFWRPQYWPLRIMKYEPLNLPKKILI